MMRALPVLAFLASCGAPTREPVLTIALPAPSAAVAVPAPPSAAPRVEPAPPPDPCEPFVARARVELVDKIPRNDAFSPDYAAFGVCVATPRGLWAIEHRGVSVVDQYVGGVAVILHIDRDGRRTEGSSTEFHYAPYASSTTAIGEAFDADGDGDDEVIVHTSFGEPSRYGGHGMVLTARGGVIAPYPPARGIDVERVEDIDGDGRPDLLTVGPYHPEEDVVCGSWEGGPDETFLLAAHARADGTFSFDDAAALAYARRGCPEAPAKIIVDATSTDNLRNARCARLWGVSAAAVTAATRAECRKQSRGCELGHGGCVHYDTLLAWARAAPPLRLAP